MAINSKNSLLFNNNSKIGVEPYSKTIKTRSAQIVHAPVAVSFQDLIQSCRLQSGA